MALSKPLPRTELVAISMQRLEERKRAVSDLLTARNASEDAVEAINEILDSLPNSVLDERFTAPLNDCTLLRLFSDFGGLAKVKDYRRHDRKIQGCEIADGMLWKGRPMTSKQRELIFDEAIASGINVDLKPGVRKRDRDAGSKTKICGTCLKSFPGNLRICKDCKTALPTLQLMEKTRKIAALSRRKPLESSNDKGKISNDAIITNIIKCRQRL